MHCQSVSDFKVIFRGVRGSHAMPGAGTIRYGGNTTCIEIRAGDRLIVLDAGTGIISLGKELLKDHFGHGANLDCTILLTHMHHDHNEGLPFFQPMYVGTSRVSIFGPEPLEENIGTVLFQSPYFPVELRELPALKFLQSLKISDTVVFNKGVPQLVNSVRTPVEFSDDQVYVRFQKCKAHPKDGVYIYRVNYRGKSVSFCTDVEGYAGGDARLIRFVEGSDLLIHDAQYTAEDYAGGAVPKQGFGHSTPEMAMDVARQAKVKQLACTHHDPDSTDDILDEMEKKAQKEMPNCFFAKEGMVVEL